ncbi:MAG: hypothetical protein M3068_11985 [Gemmatimonadota bacterium]|nr:hypothetical protein [Gemmatimonadota bacterium]
MSRLASILLRATLLIGAAPGLLLATPAVLSNAHLRAEFDERGLVALVDRAGGTTFRLEQDGFSLALDSTTFDSRMLSLPTRRFAPGRVVYVWAAGAYRLELVYELRPGWRFLSKQLFVTASPAASFRVRDVGAIQAILAETPSEILTPGSRRADLQTGDYAALLRFGAGHGLLVTAQNPFLHVSHDGRAVSLRYAPDMEWRASYGPFAADRALLAPYRLTGRRLPQRMQPEWQLGGADMSPGLDEAELSAFTELVRAFLLYHPTEPANVFVGWCVNDYQIDVATPAGRAEYKRVLDRAAELGARYVLYAPANSALARRRSSADYWGWEYVLWLGLGEQLRRNEWNPDTGAIPPSVQEMLDHARSRGLGLLAYVYPVLGFTQNPEWLAPPAADDTKRFANLGVRSLQDWLITTLVTFHRRTGVAGYSFDHTFLGFDGTSRYAQWWGWRRVMEELRRRVPDVVIDGRQAYHLYGPWSWLAGSYPHPTANDEQPESFVPFPDLHFDRVSADRERYTAYRYRNYEFAPSEIVPGFITHQTARNDDSGSMPEGPVGGDTMPVRFRARDWDLLGWRYSVLSTVAIAGWNNVLNMIPARDSAEFQHFSARDAEWMRRWLRWGAEHKEYLRHTRTILGQPAIGKVDGTSAIVGDRGYIFLFNPNGRRLAANLVLDSAIGLTTRARFTLREIHPREGRLIGAPGAGAWSYGDRLSLELDGGSATVLELVNVPPTVSTPMLLGAPGSVALADGLLQLTGVSGEVGTTEELVVLLPSASSVGRVRVNDREIAFTRRRDGAIALAVRFEGAPFRHYQQLGAYDSAFTGGRVATTLTIPKRVFRQLAERRREWPIPWTPDDYRSTWLAPERLLLFVQIAEPDDRWDARLEIDGRPIELRKAYTAIRAARRTFVGFYADVSLLSPDREYRVELVLPSLRAGQFQGLFVENVETEYTDVIAR